MHPQLEATMARGRAEGVTQRVALEVGSDGRTVRLAPDGHEVLSFATCSYLNLDRDPRLAAGAIAAIQRCGVTYSSSRCFVTTPLYAEAEELLGQVFARPVVLAGSTTLAHGAALPILLDRRDVVLFDHQVHHSVQVALSSLGRRGPRCEGVPHNDLDALEGELQTALAQGAHRVWYCADGIYSMFGDRLPIAGLAALMQRYPALHAYVDDAHGMSWCGRRGAGSVLDAALPADRTVLVTSLSKGFGATGGAIVVPDQLTKHRIENLGPSLMFSIQLPPPALGAVAASAAIHLADELAGRQQALAERCAHARARLAADPVLAARQPIAIPDGAATPVFYVVAGDADAAIAVTRALLAGGFLVNPVAFPAVPMRQGGVRFTITLAHTAADVDGLVEALGQAVRQVVLGEGGTPPLAAAG